MKVEINPALEVVAARMVVPAVARLTERVAREARLRAPDAKRWQSLGDARVRPAHREAHGQLVPDNLRYKLRRRISFRDGHEILMSGWDLGREPRDVNLPAYQTDQCRCSSLPVPGVIAAAVKTTPPVVEGPRVRGRVSVAFPRIAESEFGTSGDKASRFLGGALNVVAAELRGAHARRT